MRIPFSRKEKALYFLLIAFWITLLLPDMPVLANIALGAIILVSFFYNTAAEKKV